MGGHKSIKGDFFREIRSSLLERLEMSDEKTDEEILALIDELVLDTTQRSAWSLEEKVTLRQKLFYSVRKLDVLQELMDDETVTEIMVNGPSSIFVERDGQIAAWDKKFTSKEKLEDVIQQIVGRCNRVVNEASPIVDARLENGDRVNVVLPPVALNGPIVTIRRFSKQPITMEELIWRNSLTKECADFLENLVKARYSMVIGGGTGSGKTTFLGALCNYIPKEERIITIEDNAELQIPCLPNLVSLEARMGNREGNTQVTIRDLIRSALRMRPSRIIVGEVRGGELFDALVAFNSGHTGSLLTAHANSSRDMISRLETMMLMGMELPIEAIQRQIASGVEMLLHLGRQKDGSRKLLEVTEVADCQGGEIRLHPIFVSEAGTLERVGDLYHEKKLESMGSRDEKKR